MSRSLLITGTNSDAGKSVVTTAICRVLARRGYRVAPFKAQNMSNNSMVVSSAQDGSGAEIGRAQWIQAVAAGAEPEAAMNPVLLKPASDRRSHVVVMGQPAGRLEANEYAGGRGALAEAAFAAYDDLLRRFDAVVCEGAGSPAEINLRPWDYVNMGLAQHGSIPTILVGDIDRGGVFASLYGSVALLDAADQSLVSAFVINKFRGEVSLLRPGLETIERLTGRPVLGVLPWASGLWLDSEDALALESRPAPRYDASGQRLNIAVVMLPRISNFTDIDALTLEPAVDVTFVSDPGALAGADLVVLPGTRSTLADLRWLRDRGLAAAIAAHLSRGKAVLGICGGCQMLGRHIDDPAGAEGNAGASARGLGLLDLRTEFGSDKVLALPHGEALGAPVRGYEIHHGRIDRGGTGEPFLDGLHDGGVFGTMWHGSLESDAFRRAFLRAVAQHVGKGGFEPAESLSFDNARQSRIDALADTVEERLDVAAIVELLNLGAPAGLPTLAAGPLWPS